MYLHIIDSLQPLCQEYSIIVHGSYRWIIMLEKSGQLDLNIFHLKWIISTHGNWKKIKPWGPLSWHNNSFPCCVFSFAHVWARSLYSKKKEQFHWNHFFPVSKSKLGLYENNLNVCFDHPINIFCQVILLIYLLIAFENLLIILPMGVVSKKAIVEDKIFSSNSSCSLVEALKVPIVITITANKIKTA